VSITFGPNGNLYIADSGAHTIRMMTPLGSAVTTPTITTFAGTPGTAGLVDGVGTNARFNAPTGVAFDKNGNLTLQIQEIIGYE
jgi:DNA-binding beta-propeller fold protein YncE